MKRHNHIENSPVSTEINVQDQLQTNMSFYNSMLKLTGGTLAWEKCTAYILQFYWNNGMKFLHQTKEMYPPLKIPDIFTNTIYHILLANPTEAFRMLGAFVAPDGYTDEQVKILVTKSKEWADRLSKSFLTPHEALTAYTQVLFHALIYPVAVLALSEDQCDQVVRPAITELLKKLGMSPKTSRLLLYGPARYGGLNLPNLYAQGYIIKIMMIVGHWQKGDTTATILKITLGTSQQQVGISAPILESNYDKYSFLMDDGWVKNVWNFLNNMHGSITIKDLWVPQSNYSNDITLMDKILGIDLDQATTKRINLCRLHKQYYHISDILHSRQRHLYHDIFNPRKQRPNLEKFPTVVVPKAFWKTWEGVVKTIYQSFRLTTHNMGPVIRKEHCIWLQHENRSHILP